MAMKRYLRFGGLAVLWAFIAPVYAAQPELTKLTVGYSPISAATLPFFIALEERLFQKQGLEVVPVFFGGSPLINAAIPAGPPTTMVSFSSPSSLKNPLASAEKIDR